VAVHPGRRRASEVMADRGCTNVTEYDSYHTADLALACQRNRRVAVERRAARLWRWLREPGHAALRSYPGRPRQVWSRHVELTALDLLYHRWSHYRRPDELEACASLKRSCAHWKARRHASRAIVADGFYDRRCTLFTPSIGSELEGEVACTGLASWHQR
jgi:hypothetical protein